MYKELHKTPGAGYWKRLLLEQFIEPAIVCQKDSMAITDNEKLRVFKKYVNIINIETSSYCNRKCNYCPVSQYDRYSEKKYMSDIVFTKIINDLRSIQYNSTLCLNLYNEPLADNHIFDRIKQIKKSIPNSLIFFNSNGDYLTVPIIEKLSEIGPVIINVTLHQKPDEEYNDEDRIKHFRKFFKKLNIPFKIDTLIPEKTIKTSFKQNGIKIMVNAINYNESGNSRSGIIKHLIPKQIRTNPCLRPFREITIDYNGDSWPCCNIFPDAPQNINYKIANLQDSNLFDIYINEKMNYFRRMLFIFSEKESICKFCSDPDNSEITSKKQRDEILQTAMNYGEK